MKKCLGCKKPLNTKLFGESTRSKDGFTSKCIYCSEKARQSYHKKYHPNVVKKDHCKICAEKGVFKHACFGFSSDDIRISCSQHKTDGMIDLKNLKRGCKRCADEGIFKQASYGLNSDKVMVFCAGHKTDEMINIANLKRGCKVCSDEGVFRQPIFGSDTDKIKVACAKHRTENMIDLVHKSSLCQQCSDEGISRRASFGLITDKIMVTCSKHKTNDMVDLVNLKRGCQECLKNNILKRATFGSKTNGIRIACSAHRTKEMIDLVHNKAECYNCAEEGIFRRGSFGLVSDGLSIACSKHKTSDMVDLNNNKKNCAQCLKNGITRQNSYGLLSDGLRVACAEHRSEEMICIANLKNMCQKCVKNGVYKLATFGLNVNKRKVACIHHKTTDMIDLAHTNNNCITCKEIGMVKRATYGPLFESKIHCVIHSKKNEYSRNNPKCEKCFEKPIYGDEKLNDIPIRCEQHKNLDDVNMVSRICDNCKDEYFIPTTQTMCHGCLGWFKKKTYNRGVKETRVARCLEKLSIITGIAHPIRDRQVQKGCSKRRPDFYYPDFTDMFSLIVEVDEHQHSRYSCGILGEMQRMIILYEEDSGGFPLLFIRFNPDLYYYNKKVIKAYSGREEKLTDIIRGLKNRSTIDFSIGVIYLYYDDFDNPEITPLTYQAENGILKITHKHPHDSKIVHDIYL